MRVFDHERAKQILEERGLKRRWVSEKIGMVHTSFNQCLIGRFQPADKTVQKLADVLGVNSGELFTVVRKAQTA